MPDYDAGISDWLHYSLAKNKERLFRQGRGAFSPKRKLENSICKERMRTETEGWF